MHNERLEQQLAFVFELEKLKNIYRQSLVLYEDRQENDAEHSYHLALMAAVLAEHASEPVDVLHVMKMVLIHDVVEIDDDAALTWMRQPHYYMGLYSYTYSAFLTVATEAALRIEREGAPAVEDWKRVLAAGSTLDPAGLAKLMHIDITTDAPLRHTIAHIGEMIDEICRLTEELEG